MGKDVVSTLYVQTLAFGQKYWKAMWKTHSHDTKFTCLVKDVFCWMCYCKHSKIEGWMLE